MVASTCAREPGLASTGSSTSSAKVISLPASVKAGSHSSRCWAKTSSRCRASVVPPPVRRETLSRSSTTPVSRSTCSMHARASARTSSSLDMSSISSRRRLKPVKGVRNWWEASEANCRSAASLPATRSAVRTSSAWTRSISSMPERRRRGRTCPEPSCSASAARKISGALIRRDALAATT